MGWSPIVSGDGRTSHHTFTSDSGVFSLVGIANNSIAMHLTNINDGVLHVCTGTWSINGDGSAGKADFTPSAADISTGPFGVPGIYKAYPVVTLTSGSVAMDSQLIQVVSEA